MDNKETKSRVEEITVLMKNLDKERWRLALKGSIAEGPERGFNITFDFCGFHYSRFTTFKEIYELYSELERENKGGGNDN